MSDATDEAIVVVVDHGPIQDYDNSGIKLFEGLCEDECITFAVDQEAADQITKELDDPPDEGGGMAMCLVEPWQVMKREQL